MATTTQGDEHVEAVQPHVKPQELTQLGGLRQTFPRDTILVPLSGEWIV